MVYVSPCLRMDAKVFGKQEQILDRIRRGKRQKVYGIFLPQNPENLFEIMQVNELHFPYYQNRDMYLLGLAGSREHAVGMVCRIIAEAYREEEQPDIRRYFSDFRAWEQQPSQIVLYHGRV